MTAAVYAPPRLPDLLGTAPSDLIPDERYDSTPDEARERADRLRAGIVRYAEMRQDIADAYACRDWLALGYASWYAYVETEFGPLLAQLATGERRQAVSDMRAQGMSTRQIANATGVGQSTIRDDLKVSGVHSPATVEGTDGKSYTASRPAPKPAPTPEPAAAPSTAPAGSGSGSTSPEPERTPETKAPDVPTATTDPAAAVAAALDQHVPDPDAPKRAWGKELYARVKPVHDFLLWLKTEDVAAYADEQDLATLRHLATGFTDAHRRAVEAANSNVTPLRRIK